MIAAALLPLVPFAAALVGLLLPRRSRTVPAIVAVGGAAVALGLAIALATGGDTFDKARRLGVLPAEEADILRPAARLYHNLTQVLRLCLAAPFEPKSAGSELLGLLTRAADVPDFASLEAHLAETQAKVRASFVRILGRAP